LVGLQQYRDICDKCGAKRIDKQIGLEPTVAAYVDKLVEVFREVRRVLVPTGCTFLVIGDSYIGGGGFSANAPSTEETKSGQYGSLGALKAGGIKPYGDLKPKDLAGVPWSVALALRADGWYLRSDIIWAKRNPLPESCKDRPTRSHEHVFLLAKSAKYYYDAAAISEPTTDDEYRIRGKVRPDTSIYSAPCPDGPQRIALNLTRQFGARPTRNKRDVWPITAQGFSDGNHFAVFPEALVEPCIKAGCPPGGTVLDPFAGSGTVGIVSKRFGCKAVLIELSEQFCSIARKRLRQGSLEFLYERPEISLVLENVTPTQETMAELWEN
jgi:DNA modification methylase